MALARRLNELPKGDRLHQQLLKAFEQHGHEAAATESVDFLSRLKRTRDDVAKSSSSTSIGASQRNMLQKWHDETTRHSGFRRLRERLFSEGEGGFHTLPGPALSRTYNLLRRMNLAKEADEVWPTVASRVGEGTMKDPRELLGVWSAAPQEHLQQLDAQVAQAMGTREPLTWQLISAFSRVAELPGSKTALWCGRKLSENTRDLASEDLVAVLAALHPRSGVDLAGALPHELRQVAKKAKAELVARDGALEPEQLCRLLSVIEDSGDSLWPMLRGQLLGRQDDLNALQVLQVCSFLDHLPGSSASEVPLFKGLTGKLKKMLATRNQTGLIDLTARHLNVLVGDFPTCQSLLNAAVRMRRDLYPAVLWKVFLSSGQVDLVSKYPDLQNRFQRIGEVLEQFTVKMPLSEMRDAVAAMRKNQTPLPKCVTQMAKQFCEVLERAEANQGGGAAAEAEAVADAAGAAAEGAGSESWLGEAQALTVGFWADLQLLGVEEPEVAQVIAGFCAPGGNCRIEPAALVASIQELDAAAADVSQAADFRDNLVAHLRAHFPRLRQRSLVEAADAATSRSLRLALVQEVERRLLGGRGAASVSTLRRGVDLDDLVALLGRFTAWQVEEEGREAPQPLVAPELAQRIMDLVAESLPGIIREEKEAGGRRLLATVKAFAAQSASARSGQHLAQLTRALHQLALPPLKSTSASTAGKPRQMAWTPGAAAELAQGVAAIHGGVLPLDVAARLQRLLGAALRGAAVEDGRGPARSGAEAMAAAVARDGAAADLWAFDLATRHSSSAPALAALQMLPEAEPLQACLTQLEQQRPEQARFGLEQEPDAASTLARLRSGLPDCVPAGEPLEERYAVPGTPYVADVALTGLRALLVVPRSSHRAPGNASSGPGQLMERTLEARGWRLHWIWPQEWGGARSPKEVPLEVERMQELLGLLSPEGGGATEESVAEAEGPQGSAAAAASLQT